MTKADAIAEACESRLNERSSQSSIVAGVALVSVGILYVVALGTAAFVVRETARPHHRVERSQGRETPERPAKRTWRAGLDDLRSHA